MWRRAVKILEEKLRIVETELSEKKKNERKLFARQKFFEKYCSQAEEKIE